MGRLTEMCTFPTTRWGTRAAMRGDAVVPISDPDSEPGFAEERLVPLLRSPDPAPPRVNSQNLGEALQSALWKLNFSLNTGIPLDQTP